MERRILVGSIIAVVILVLVSFTGVVGYQTTKSFTIARVSPLFTVRTSRAIGQGQQDITTDYLGHGEETNLRFSSRTKRTEQAQKAVNIISKMDDKVFSKFVTRIILHLKYQEKLDDEEISDMLQALFYIRDNPNVMKYYNTKDSPIETLEYITCLGFPGCLIGTIWSLLVIILVTIYVRLTVQFSCGFPPICQTFPPCAI